MKTVIAIFLIVLMVGAMISIASDILKPNSK